MCEQAHQYGGEKRIERQEESASAYLQRLRENREREADAM